MAPGVAKGPDYGPSIGAKTPGVKHSIPSNNTSTANADLPLPTAPSGLKCDIKDGNSVIVNDDLTITFHRTIRVPDNNETSYLPPGLGEFPLERVSDFTSKLPINMLKTGGVFFPMYQREAMWIGFHCKKGGVYMIKIYVGGVNAVSGETAVEGVATRLKRLKIASSTSQKWKKRLLLQDYVVVPDQLWLDGVVHADGSVRQFVVMPFGSGYSVEAQLTGEEVTGGLQFEVTPLKVPPVDLASRKDCLFVKPISGEAFTIKYSPYFTVDKVKRDVEDYTEIPTDEQRLVYRGRQLEDGRTLGDYNISEGSVFHLVTRLRGGGGGPLPPEMVAAAERKRKVEMVIAAGGAIKQAIKRDMYTNNWDPSKTTVFNVHILDAAKYREVTAKDPPPTSIDAATYAEHGYPFYELPEEPSGVHGDFSKLKSVAQMDNAVEEHVTPQTVCLGNSQEMQERQARLELQRSLSGITNPAGPLREFRSVHDLAKELGNLEL